MDPVIVNAVLNLVGLALKKLASDKELQNKVLKGSQSVDDWMQEARGNVNSYSLEDAIQIALSTSQKRDKDTICRVIAIITTLYCSHEVSRSAICGGTLLKYLGEDVFPHIDEKELRFAKELNSKIIESIATQVSGGYEEYLGEYIVNDSVDYSLLPPPLTSQLVIQPLAKPFVQHGASIFGMIRKFFS